ncbi:pep-2 [Clostera anastomosis granulovirus B]|uniref:Pep-2 n=1 Tax=Clostera anastomosis granulovirus B TaxID=1986290 RepID=A0A0K0WSH2_9BBAC|nr:pep-2 [Clostera anastomosis granulovirus B]AKS25363.1 pep-2 [Clostera anastomosis granulovirus B]
MSMNQCGGVFTKVFDGIDVPFLFIDMTLWVGAEETLRILKVSNHALASLPSSEKSTLDQLFVCNNSGNVGGGSASGCSGAVGPYKHHSKLFITALGVGLLCSRLVNRGSILPCENSLSHNNQLPERVNAFANIFLTDVVSEIKMNCLLCGVSKTEDLVLNLLNEPVVA